MYLVSENELSKPNQFRCLEIHRFLIIIIIIIIYIYIAQTSIWIYSVALYNIVPLNWSKTGPWLAQKTHDFANKGDFILWKPGNHHRTQMMMFWRRYNDLFRSVVWVGENPGKEVANSFGSKSYQWGLITLSKFPLEGWIFGAQRAKNETPRYSKTKSQRSEPKWLLKYLISPNFCARFQPNRLTTTFGPWNTFSDNNTY